MKILWLCNFVIPIVAEKENINTIVSGGWVESMLQSILQTPIEIGVCSPAPVTSIKKGCVENLTYYIFPQSNSPYNKYDQNIEKHFYNIIEDWRPDIVHLWGAEFPTALSMIRVYNNPSHTVINIQGLCSVYSKHYFAGLPQRIINRFSIRDIIKWDSIRLQQNKLIKRGKMEIETLKSVGHVIGRTDWDKSCTEQINPSVEYHFCNESLRNSFYNNEWSIETCKKHSIFISQAGYPIKGFHYIIMAIPEILKRYPDTELYVTGKDIFQIPFYKTTSYWKYLMELINKHNIQDKIHWLGTLNEQQMCDQLLNSNVSVLPSSIENSPNSLGEAMLLGVPCVASCVGGVTSLLTHNINGYVYQHDAPYMLSYYVCKIFDNEDLTKDFSYNARKISQQTYDKDINSKKLIQIYNDIDNN